MKALVIAVVFAMTMAVVGCTSEAKTVSTLQRAGYTEIEALGYDFWECGDDDTYATKFRAKNPQGMVVTGTVCCGLMAKGCTIRF